MILSFSNEKNNMSFVRCFGTLEIFERNCRTLASIALFVQIVVMEACLVYCLTIIYRNFADLKVL